MGRAAASYFMGFLDRLALSRSGTPNPMARVANQTAFDIYISVIILRVEFLR